MTQITLKQLEAFVAVADLGSFRRAADKLHTTQPNISARIAGLEGLLQQRLMRRDAGSITLTPRGETLLTHARAVLSALDDMVAAAGNARLFDGTLRLGVTEMIVHSWLGPYLAALRDRFANVDIALRVDVSKTLSEALHAREIDLALQNGPFQRQASGMVALGRYAMAWVASPDLPLPQRGLTLDDLARQPILTHAAGTLPHDQIKAHIAQARGIRLIPSTNITAALAMTQQRLGVACMPEIMVREEIASGRLIALDYPWRPDDLVFCARYEAETAPHYVAEAARLAGDIAHWAGVVPPTPGVAIPQRGQQMALGGIRPAVGDVDLNQDVILLCFGVFNHHIEIAVVGKNAGIKQLVFKIKDSAPSIFAN